MSTEVRPEITSEDGSYSPVQRRFGVERNPTEESFPPHNIRVPQENYELPRTVGELGISRVTLQSGDLCSLRCPGCYISEWVDPRGEVRTRHHRALAGGAVVASQLGALGGNIQDIYWVGAEPTITPGLSDTIREVARNMGATVMCITNGANEIGRYEETFRGGISSGEIYKINISLDSIDPDIHNHLRGRSWAFDRTMATIQHALENQDPLNINITVWPDNYHTILDTVTKLYDMGVRGFAFHAGSLEGARKDSKLEHVEPAAWRALVAVLLEFRDLHTDLEHFTLPYIFFSKEELDKGVIGNPESVAKYEDHLQKLEQGINEPNPVRVCPALGIPQIYLFSNDSNDGVTNEGAISLCNMHTIGASKKHGGAYFANYNTQANEFVIEEDPNHNELEIMRKSPFLCPAREYTMGSNARSDRFETEVGDLYHACRYISANQFPGIDKGLARDLYEVYKDKYRQRGAMSQKKRSQ